MSKSTVKEESKKPESKKEKEQAAAPQQPGSDIAQPDPNAEDKQGYIRENARKGESIPVPNTIGPDSFDTPLDK